MTTPDQGTDEGPPGQPVNAEPIRPLTPADLAPVSPGEPEQDRGGELLWTLFAGLGPFVLALLVHGGIAGWNKSTIDPANLGYCLFALTLAAFVRIVSHGSGRKFSPILLMFGLIQIAFALYFGGTFNSATVNKAEVGRLENTISTNRSLSPLQLSQAGGLMATINDNDHLPSDTVYICLGATGVLSGAILLRFWSPRISEQKAPV